jgi:class 3 adenylate cyclase
MKKPWAVATQTLSFLFADVEGSPAMSRRLGGEFAGMLANYHRLLREALSA